MQLLNNTQLSRIASASSLRLADDIVLASDQRELQTMLEQLNVESKAVCLEISLLKTQVMFNNHIDEKYLVHI